MVDARLPGNVQGQSQANSNDHYLGFSIQEEEEMEGLFLGLPCPDLRKRQRSYRISPCMVRLHIWGEHLK